MSKLLRIIPLALMFCTACSGSGSMRIDVEVYKGPLSKEPFIQFADLLGFLDEIKRGLDDMATFTNAVAMNKDFNNETSSGTKKPSSKFPLSDDDKLQQLKKLEALYRGEPQKWCRGLDPEGVWDQIDFFDCIMLQKLRDNNDRLSEQIARYDSALKTTLESPNTNRDVIEKLLTDLGRFAGEMRKNPFSWSIPGTAGHSLNFKVRIAVVLYIVMTAEYGNQLHARLDSLMKQLDDGGFDRKELPLSVYISDTEPTDFIHLFDQWDAAGDRSWGWLATVAIDGSVKDRINMVKRLFADHHWSKINTAYASGWGKTRMAFVKDDIGNWNLKNFDNAPEDLLKAYTILGKSALDRAATLAMEANSGGAASLIGTLVKLSRSVSLPSQGQGAASSARLLTDLHHRAEIRLRETGWKAIEAEKLAVSNPSEKNAVQIGLIKELRSILGNHGELVDLASNPAAQ